MRSAIQLGALLFVSGPLLAFGSDRPPSGSDRDDAPSSEAPSGGTDAPAPAERVSDPMTPHASGPAPDTTDDVDDVDDVGTSEDTEGIEEGDESSPVADAPDGGRRRPRGGCPSTMVRAGAFCIDRYEAPNRRGARPFVMQSANDANSWCSDHHKRLCTEDEWIAACQGEERRTYPYGNEHVDGRCNDDKAWEKVDEATLAKWPSAEAKARAKELYQATPSGSKRKCTSEAGARDMTGNVEEWVLRTREHANDWPYILIGCYWSGCYGGNKPTCHSTNNAHGPEFRFYETGFRCCKDATGKK